MRHASHPSGVHRLLAVGAFTLAYLLAASIGAFATGNTEFVFYIAVMVLLIGSVVWVDRRVGLSAGLLWGLSVWGGLHMAGGLVPVPEGWPIQGQVRVLYSWWILSGYDAEGGVVGFLKYDQLVHAYGFGMATWLCWQGLRGALASPDATDGTLRTLRPTAGTMLLVALAGMGLGAVNEIVEFFATRLTTTNVGGYVNTGWDLVANAVGAGVASVAIGIGERRKQR